MPAGWRRCGSTASTTRLALLKSMIGWPQRLHEGKKIISSAYPLWWYWMINKPSFNPDDCLKRLTGGGNCSNLLLLIKFNSPFGSLPRPRMCLKRASKAHRQVRWAFFSRPFSLNIVKNILQFTYGMLCTHHPPLPSPQTCAR